MPLTLASAIGPDDLVLVIEGEVPDSVVTGYSFRLDDELLTLISFARIESVSGRRTYPQPVDLNRWNVSRGLADSEAVEHDAGTALEGSSDAWSSSDDTTPPGPFPAPSGPGGDTPSLADVLAEGADADGHKITGLDDPTDDQDAATKAYVDDQLGGDPFIPALANVLAQGADADGNKITGMADPDDDQDAATKKYVDDNAGGTPAANAVTVDDPTATALDAATVQAALQVLSVRTQAFNGETGQLATDLDADGVKITDLADPENPADAATKAYVDSVAGGGGGTVAVRNLGGDSPEAITGTFSFQLQQFVPPTGGDIVLHVPLADGVVDVTIPWNVGQAGAPDDTEMAAIWDDAFPGQLASTMGVGADTFAEGRAFLIGFQAGNGHLPIDFPTFTFDDNLTGGANDDPAVTVPDDTTPGSDGVDADLVLDFVSTKLWGRFAGGFEQIYPAIG